MKHSIACGLAAGLLLAACQVPTGPEANHWNLESIGPRIAYNSLGYRAEEDGSYREFQWRQKQDINHTLRRHFFNDSPTNPFQASSTEIERRPPNSLLPDPVTFLHIDALAWGAVMLGASGAFVPIPVSSLLGMFEKGGATEFWEGIEVTATGESWDGRGMPTPPEEFRVHNK